MSSVTASPRAVPVVILGSGPYGLSVAAQLASRDVPFRIFGKAMATWREHMPQDMLLKSEPFASNLSAPGVDGTLERYCAEMSFPYSPTGTPVSLDRFVSYANWFQKRFVPQLEQLDAVRVTEMAGEFIITLEDNSVVQARNVVVATGITWFRQIPKILAGLPDQFVSHSYDHRDAAAYSGKRVVVVGAGASAIDVASLFSEAGAVVQVLTRQPKINFHNPPGQRSLFTRIRHPQTGIGPGLRSSFYCSAPLAFRRLPAPMRSSIVRTHLRAAPGWFMREKIEGKVAILLGQHLQSAAINNNLVELTVRDNQGTTSKLEADHVIAATGYAVDVSKVQVLDAALQTKVWHYQQAPLLSDNFESSAKGLYFVGPAAAHSFGPLLRFAFGAEWVAPRIARHFAAKNFS